MAKVLVPHPTRPGYQEVELAEGASFSHAEFSWTNNAGTPGGYALTEVSNTGGGDIALNADGFTLEFNGGQFIVMMDAERTGAVIDWAEIQLNINGVANRSLTFGDDGVGEPGGGSFTSIIDARTAQQTVSYERINFGGSGLSTGRVVAFSIGVVVAPGAAVAGDAILSDIAGGDPGTDARYARIDHRHDTTGSRGSAVVGPIAANTAETFAHGIVGLVADERLIVQFEDVPSDEPATVRWTNDLTDLTITPVAAIGAGELRVTWVKAG